MPDPPGCRAKTVLKAALLRRNHQVFDGSEALN